MRQRVELGTNSYCCDSLYRALCMGHITEAKNKSMNIQSDSKQRYMTIVLCPFCGKKKMITRKNRKDQRDIDGIHIM